MAGRIEFAALLADCIMFDVDAGVAQLVEHHVANVIVVGSSPITRSFESPVATR